MGRDTLAIQISARVVEVGSQVGSSRGSSQPVSLCAWSRCEETKRPREAAPVLTAAGSGVLDGFGSFRGGGRKRGVQPAPLEETSPQLEPKTRRAAGEPELTPAVPRDTAHPLQKVATAQQIGSQICL